jgi:HlyD family secretion protein
MRGVTFAALLLMVSCNGGGDDDLVTVARQDLPITVEATGSLRAVESTTIGPPTIANVWRFKIASMAEESAQVKEGEMILSLDPAEMREELEQKVAERDQAAKEIENRQLELEAHYLDLDRRVAEASARLRRAQMKVDVPRELEKRLELEKARLDLQEAESEVASLTEQRRQGEISGKSQIETLEFRRDRADQRVKELEDGLAKLNISAPRDGLVIQVENWRGEKKKIGDTVSRWDDVLQIPDLNAMEATTEIDEADAGRVAVGQQVTLRLEAHPQIEYTGQVAEIAPTVRRQSRRSQLKVYRVLIRLDETDTETMRPGTRLRADIEGDRMVDALVIPLESVVPRNDGPVVLAGAGGNLREIPVELGVRNESLVEVRGGLELGQTIARRGARAAEGGGR